MMNWSRRASKRQCATGSGNTTTLWDVAGELLRRMTNIFLRDEKGRRPVFGNLEKFQTDPHWRDLVLFHEYFHGDSGSGTGRQSSNRMDRRGCQVDVTERRMLNQQLPLQAQTEPVTRAIPRADRITVRFS
jgi:hypothetical protein